MGTNNQAAGGTATGEPEGVGVEDIVIALQKSFSRVSTRTAKVSTQAARALVVGRVNFELGLRVEPEADNRLLHSPSGSIELKLTGQINTDIRVSEDQ
jgi:hypothetical protein